MSLHALNGENAGEDLAAGNCAMLLTSAETTGRTSILRLSQKENLPPKGIVKPMKVTFQTPLRDPQTRRILSPDRKKKAEISLVTDNLLLPTCTAVRSQPTMTTEIPSGKEKVPTEGEVLIPDLSDDLSFLSTVHDVEPFQSSGNLLNFSNGQKLPLWEDFTGFSLSGGSLSFPQSVPENTPSEEAGCTTRNLFSLLDSLLHDDDVSKQILSCDHAPNLVSTRTCNSEPLPIFYLQNPPLQPIQKFGSFENLNNDEIKNIEKETSTETRESWAPKLSDCMIFDSDFDTFGCAPNIPATECPAPGLEKSDVSKDEADIPQTQEPKVPDTFETMELIPRSLKEIKDRILAKSQAVAENDGGSEPPEETQEKPKSISPEAWDQGDVPLNGQLPAGDPLPQALCGRTEPESESNLLFTENEEFRSPMEVLGTQIDYLEQFGMASLKESVLRKQSLYLKFDPLLRDSPKKKGPDPDQAAFPIAALLQNGTSTKTASTEVKAPEQEEKLVELDSLIFPDLAKAPADIPADQEVPPFSCAQPLEAVADVLKPSEKEMEEALQQVKLERDAAVQNLTAKIQEKQTEALEWKKKHDKIYAEKKEMEKIVAEFEDIIVQVMEDCQTQKELAKKELQKALDAKQQAVSDLNALEKSFSEFFNRFTKQKEAIEGFQKNEDTLKKCVEDYLERIKKEEQRYQALKAHAEEKLDQANEEIAQVRSKAKSEVAALDASLRKEQMRVQSLESSIEQKVKENKELTKICEELISKMEKLC
ncbi:transforming acidic coiled-coil-containing protein 3 isoform X2 [Pantherophis guttatus]|uniref:Transforming acidic coiled-coil-containing protein 3 isoform X2 n=1 Tax=Pantherophis guttatus TaxID=94885 RepID=A0A6P9BWV7_PANGU|nr:transforming acidic coiled-coil-containing protein 3 isoform X2 [Pantherophis guttatus]